MSNRAPATQNTKAGIFNNLLKDQTEQNNSFGPNRDSLNKFLDSVGKAGLMPLDGDSMPWVEAPMEIVHFYLKSPAALQAFEQTKYFIFQNVKVYAEGKRQEALAIERLTPEQRTFGKDAL